MGLKFPGTEIDCLFMGDLGSGAVRNASLARPRALVAVEAKGKSDDILKGQIGDQATVLFGISAFKDEIDAVVPMAAKLDERGRLFVVEYDFVRRGKPVQLQIASEAFYNFTPSIGGLD